MQFPNVGKCGIEYIIGKIILRLPHLTAGYALEDIYNADETGLYYRALPAIDGDPRRSTEGDQDF